MPTLARSAMLTRSHRHCAEFLPSLPSTSSPFFFESSFSSSIPTSRRIVSIIYLSDCRAAGVGVGVGVGSGAGNIDTLSFSSCLRSSLRPRPRPRSFPSPRHTGTIPLSRYDSFHSWCSSSLSSCSSSTSPVGGSANNTDPVAESKDASFGELSSSDREVVLTPLLSSWSMALRGQSDGKGTDDDRYNDGAVAAAAAADDDDSLPSGAVAKLTLNRPKRANAFGRLMLGQFVQILDALTEKDVPGGDGSGGGGGKANVRINGSASNPNDDDDDDHNICHGHDDHGDRERGHDNIGRSIRAIVLTSSSKRVFSAGADLKERLKMTQHEASDFVTSLRHSFHRLGTDVPMPVIAAVDGAALGGGLELALSADIVVCGRDATFGLPETSLAILPGAGGTVRLPRRVGVSRAKEMIFTARKNVDASEALQMGLVDYVAGEGETAEEKALEIAFRIAQNGPLSIRAAKRSIQQGMECRTISEAMDVERECYASILDTSDRLEGLKAFRESRKPVYRGQ